MLDNIKKIFKILDKTNDDFYLLEVGDHLITNNGPYKKRKCIKSRRTKNKTDKSPLTLLNNYYCWIINVRVDANL